MNRNWILRVAGLMAMITALFHAYEGDAILRDLIVTPVEQLSFVRATHQLGAMGWMAGGILLIGFGSVRDQRARNWLVGVLAILYGFPAVGNFVLNGGRPSFGWIALSLTVILAIWGRRVSAPPDPILA